MPETFGPIDLVVLEFPAGTTADATAAAIVDLVDRGVVRLYDILAVRRDADGAIELDLDALDGDLDALAPLAGARSGLIGPEDLADAAAVLDPDTVAVVLLYENAWAVPFVAAAHGEGGQLVVSSRLTAQEILDALDAVEAG